MAIGTGESPKSVLRQAAAAQVAALSEDKPDEIVRRCEIILRGTPEQAGRMLNPLVELDYEKLEPKIVQMVEDTLFYAMTGGHRQAQPR
jgi:hypothetical protein